VNTLSPGDRVLIPRPAICDIVARDGEIFVDFVPGDWRKASTRPVEAG
jgi:hypothetical protein